MRQPVADFEARVEWILTLPKCNVGAMPLAPKQVRDGQCESSPVTAAYFPSSTFLVSGFRTVS
jgi:hypothetical protein